MKTRLTMAICALCLGFSYPCLAQDNDFKNGVITFKTGESRSGLILYRNWTSTPYSISFKNSTSDAIQKLDTTSLKSFEINDHNIHEFFENHRITIDISPWSDQLMARTSRQPELIERSLFLRRIYQGFLTLYKINLGQKDHFYISKSGSVPSELVYRRFQEGQKIFVDDSFRKQLQDYLHDCPESLFSGTRNIAYTEAELIRTLQSCDQLEKGMKEISPRIAHNLGIGAGMSSSTSSFKGDNMENISFRGKPSVYLNIFGEIMIDRHVKRFSVFNELAYKSVKTNGSPTTQPTGYISVQSYNIDLDYLKLFNLARYYFPFNKHRTFINAGVSSGLLLNGRQTLTTFNSLRNETTVKPIYEDQRMLENGLAFGAGTSLGKFQLEGRFESTNGYSPYSTKHNNINTFFALFSYRLF